MYTVYSYTAVKSLTKKNPKTIEDRSDTPCRQTTHRLHVNYNRLNVAKLPEIQQEKCNFDLTCAKK